MTKLKLFVCLFLALPCYIFSEEKDFPVAKKIPYYYVTHGNSVLQNYYWMRTKKDRSFDNCNKFVNFSVSLSKWSNKYS